MTVTDLASRRDMTDAEKRTKARDYARDNPDVSGAELGRMFGKNATWGVDRKNVALYGTRRPPRQTATRDATDSTPAEEGGTTAARGSTEDTVRDVTPVTVPVPRHEPVQDVPPVGTDRSTGWAHRIKVAGVVLVAAVAAVISYTHMRHLGIQAGEGWRADVLPLSVDGMMAVASMTALERRRAGKKAGALALTALVLGVTASLAANIVSVDPTLVDQRVVERVIAAWPPLALVLAFELLLEQGRDQ